MRKIEIIVLLQRLASIHKRKYESKTTFLDQKRTTVVQGMYDNLFKASRKGNKFIFDVLK